MAEILTMAQIEQSDVYISETSETLSFLHTLDYLKPFMDILEPLGATFTFEGELGSISKERAREDVEEQQRHIAYKSVIAKAKLPDIYNLNLDIDSTHKNLWSEIGIVYNLSGKNPEMRAYRGKRVEVCTNMCVWGSDNVTSINLSKSSTRGIYESLKFYADNAAEDLGKYREVIERLHSNRLADERLLERIGHIIWQARLNPKLGITCANDMVSYLQDNKSKYALVNGTTTDWMLYNACTESLKKSSILDEANKTLLLDKIFNNN